MRRSRKEEWSRRLVRENTLSGSDFVLPIFLTNGVNKKQEIKSMKGVYRYSIDNLSSIIDRAIKNKIPMLALFPNTNKKIKDNNGTEALNENNLVSKAIIKIKKKNVAVIMVEQNAKQALSISDRGFVLVTGQNKFKGSGEDLLNDPEVRRSFLGV